jgi:hypothetical protein
MPRGAAAAQSRGNIVGAAWRHACRSTTANRRADIAIVLLMTELDASSGHSAEDHSASTIRLVRRQLPFLAILVLAIGGVAYTNISQRPLVGYWEFLAIAMGVVCVVTQWSELEDKQARFRLMWTQALHWLAVLVTMNIMLFSGVQQVLPTLATGLVLLILLALGTFLAGVHLVSLQIGFLGLALALAVPAISWVKHSALFLILAVVFFVGLAMAFWSYWSDAHPAASGRRTAPFPEQPKAMTGGEPQ